MEKELVIQEDSFGCAVVCVAFVLSISYKEALNLFEEGKVRAQSEGFYCREIAEVLTQHSGNLYGYRYRGSSRKGKFRENTIVLIKKSKKYPEGHYLSRVENKWMDPWSNFPILPRRARLRRNLPDKPIYEVFPKEQV